MFTSALKTTSRRFSSAASSSKRLFTTLLSQPLRASLVPTARSLPFIPLVGLVSTAGVVQPDTSVSVLASWLDSQSQRQHTRASSSASASSTDAKDAQPFTARSVQTVLDPSIEAEGRGAVVRRSVGSMQFRNFDPFLMLDDFSIPSDAGFPAHPHRGFETVTLVYPFSKGKLVHEDFAENAGSIGPGDVQWMTAGKGVMHAEIPGNEHPVEGIQLWVNLAAKHKMVEPAYQNLHATHIPTVIKDGISAYIIAGTALGKTVDVRTLTPAHYVYYTLQPGAVLRHALPADWNALVYTISGDVASGKEEQVPERKAIIYERVSGDEGHSGVEVRNSGAGEAVFALIAGQPLNEPIARGGPFVMNTEEEVRQARQEFQQAKNGFERVASWTPKLALKK